VLSNLTLHKNLHYFSGPSMNVRYDVDYWNSVSDYI
jgi:hypothetical protein